MHPVTSTYIEKDSGYFTQPREAVFAQAEEIADVVNAAFIQGDVFRKEDQKRTSKNEVEDAMKAPGHTWYVLEHCSNDIKRIAATLLYTSDSDKGASIHMLSAHQDYRGHKKAAELLAFVEKIAHSDGKVELNLSVAQIHDRLINYYENLGYERIRKSREYFSAELQCTYLKTEYQGYNREGKANLRCIDMTKFLANKGDCKDDFSLLPRSSRCVYL